MLLFRGISTRRPPLKAAYQPQVVFTALQARSAPAPGADSSSGPNDNLLAIAMEHRRSLGSTSTSRPNTPRRTSTPRPAAKPRAAADPSTSSDGSGYNDNLLAIALAERAKGSSSPRRAASHTRSASPTTLRASPEVGPSQPKFVRFVNLLS